MRLSSLVPLTLSAFVLTAMTLPAAAQERQDVRFEIAHVPSAAGFGVYVLGDLPELGGDDLIRAVKLVSVDGSSWRVIVSLPANRTYTYRYYERFDLTPADPANGTPIGDPVTAQTNPVAFQPDAKIVYVHSSLDPAVFHWRQDEGPFAEITMEEVGPGRMPDEKRWVAGPFGESRHPIEFFVSASDGSQRDPEGTTTYRTPLDAFLLQDEEIFSYIPSAAPSVPRRDYAVLPSGLSDVTFASTILGESYDVRVLLPRGYDEHRYRRYPVVYHMDGSYLWEDPFFAEPYDADGALTAELTRLGETAEAIHVGIDNVRFAEGTYDCRWWETRARDHTPPGDTTPPGIAPGCIAVSGEGDRFAAFLRNELKPWIDDRYRTRPESQHTSVAGQSQTALGAFYLGWDFPETFGGAGVQSVYVRGATNFLARLRGEPKEDLRVYVDAGSQEFTNLGWALDLRDDLVGRVPDPHVVEGDLRFFVGAGQGHTVPAAASRWPQMLSFLRPSTDDPPECWDGIDNDGDGRIDYARDPGAGDGECVGALDLSERENACSDGVDNDDPDDLVDFDDPGCVAAPGPENPQCDDGEDNDGNGLVDGADPKCTSNWPYWESPPVCGLGAELTVLLAPLLWLYRRRRLH
jgi:enterochelin esterase-like enzyme